MFQFKLNILKFFPVDFLSIVMGLAGFSLTLFQIEIHPDTPDFILGYLSGFFAWISLIIFIIILGLLVVKFNKYKEQTIQEFNDHKISGLFGSIPISLTLLAACFFEISHQFSEILWLIGATLQLLFSILMINRWIYSENLSIEDITPIWFIPVVGNILIPITGVQFVSLEFNWLFFSIGLFFWVIVFALLIFRLFFQKPLDIPLYPSMFIMLAPPSAGFVALTTLQPELTVLANFLYYNAIFIFLLLLVELPNFIRLPFKLSAWSYSFPLAILSLANFRMHELSNLKFIGWFSWSVAILFTVVIIWLIFNTVRAIINHQICMATPE